MAKKKTAKKKAAETKNAMREAAAKHVAATKNAAARKAAKKKAAKATTQKSVKKKAVVKKVVKKKAAASSELSELTAMRGVVSFDTNEIIILVRGTCGKVAEALRGQKKLDTWVKNAVGKSVTVDGPSFLVYQFKTHPWVIVDGFWGGYPNPEDAEELSRLLDTRTIFYGNSDTSCVTQYNVYDSGKEVEYFESGDNGLKFRSEIRKIKAPKDGPDIYSFVFDFIEAQDAFAPSWSLYLFNGSRHKKGDRVKLAFEGVLNKESLERFDYLSG
jgi:hypothetical protein